MALHQPSVKGCPTMAIEGSGTAVRVVRMTRTAAWATLVVGTVVGLLILPDDVESVLVFTSVIFFGLLLARVLAAAVAWPAHRAALFLLAAGISLWAIGSASITVGEAVTFPSWSEVFFISSLLCMAAYLLIGVSRHHVADRSVWLEATVIVGGAACVTGMLFLTPLASAASEQPVPMLVALLLPMLDVMMVLVIAAQSALRMRAWSWRTFKLALGFLLLAIADLSLLSYQADGYYAFTPSLNIAWGIALLLIVGAACSAAEDVATIRSRPGGVMLVSASAVALFVLVWETQGTIGNYLRWPAVITLVAAGARLVLALRESRHTAEAVRLSRTDDVTDLPNRRYVLARLSRGLRQDEPLTLLLVDLDGFKEVNDSLGHSAGDDVLRLAADRIRMSVSPEVVVARLSGDEFAIVVADDDPLRIVELGQRVRRALRQPARLDGVELVLHSTVGVATRIPGDTDGSDLLRRADIALYEAKTTRAGILGYDPGADVFSRDRLRLAEDLRRAIDDHRLEVWYQPQIHAATQRVCGMEALVRWRHPSMGIVSPAVFLPTARRSGLMLALSEVVASLVVADASRWSQHGLSFPVSINVAPPELLGGTLIPWLLTKVNEARLAPGSLVVEVTEDSFLSDPDRAREVLIDCHRHGLQVSVDDYGTGFSSLSYLRDLPLDELKIDRSFVAAAMVDAKSHNIVDFTTQMAHALGVRIVAEGVEDATTTADLVAMGVDVLQGYHLSRPMPSNAVESWVLRWEGDLVNREPAPNLPDGP